MSQEGGSCFGIALKGGHDRITDATEYTMDDRHQLFPHKLTTARRDADLRRLLDQAALVVSDGRPLVWSLRRQGFAAAEQVRGPDLTWRLCEAAAEGGLPVWFHGGDPALARALEARLRLRLPGLVVAGIEVPPMLPARPPADPHTAARIRRSGARLVFVGLGCPKQELWMQAQAPLLDSVLIGVGQAFGIVAGHVAEAPPWMQRSGLEWLFRLAREPRRLWRRYLVGNTTFLALELAGRLRRRP